MNLVVVLPDGSSGTVRADAADVLGVVRLSGLVVVLDGAGFAGVAAAGGRAARVVPAAVRRSANSLAGR